MPKWQRLPAPHIDDKDTVLQTANKYALFKRGVKLSFPVILGYAPVGIAFGILAVQAGMHPVAVGMMSYFVYAGAAQLIAIGLLSAGVSTPGIILTTFVVNLRHALMSASLTPYLKNWPKLRQALFCYGLTDETYALNLSRFMHAGVVPEEVFGINTTAHLAWTASGICGALMGDVIGDITRFGFDFALVGMFIALLLPHAHIPRRIIAICCGAIFSLVFYILGVGQWSVVVATVLAATTAAAFPLNRKYTAEAFSHRKTYKE